MFLIPVGTYLVFIEPPSSGLTVKYLKDIVQYGQLFVRPIQLDISEQHQVEPNLVCHNRYNKYPPPLHTMKVARQLNTISHLPSQDNLAAVVIRIIRNRV